MWGPCRRVERLRLQLVRSGVILQHVRWGGGWGIMVWGGCIRPGLHDFALSDMIGSAGVHCMLSLRADIEVRLTSRCLLTIVRILSAPL